jgi:hypothetical protein
VVARDGRITPLPRTGSESRTSAPVLRGRDVRIDATSSSSCSTLAQPPGPPPTCTLTTVVAATGYIGPAVAPLTPRASPAGPPANGGPGAGNDRVELPAGRTSILPGHPTPHPGCARDQPAQSRSFLRPPTPGRARETDPGRRTEVRREPGDCARPIGRARAPGAATHAAFCRPHRRRRRAPHCGNGPAPTPASVLTLPRAPGPRAQPTYTNPSSPAPPPHPERPSASADVYYLVPAPSRTSRASPLPQPDLVPLASARSRPHARRAAAAARGGHELAGIYARHYPPPRRGLLRGDDPTCRARELLRQGPPAPSPWSDPIFVREAEFKMDPSHFFNDDDGNVYLHRHGGGRDGRHLPCRDPTSRRAFSARRPGCLKGTPGASGPRGRTTYKVD